MNYRDKIRMWLKQNGWKDGDLAKAAGHHSGKIADLLNSKHGPTITLMAPIAKAMNVSLDWLADDELDWPPIPRNAGDPTVVGRVLSEAETKLLDSAHVLCIKDADPTLLMSARYRLMAGDGEGLHTPEFAPRGETKPPEVQRPGRKSKG